MDSDVGPLPYGWERRIDNKSGRPYYANLISKTTTWSRPIEPAVASQSDYGSQEGDDWEKFFDELSGQAYYVNHSTRETTWERPVFTGSSIGASTPTQELPKGEEEFGPLPADWERRFDQKSGRYYYANLVTKTTQWKRPIKSESVPAKEELTRLLMIASDESEKKLGSLPDGWEMCITLKARIYFRDYNNRITTFEDPRIIVEKDVDLPQYKRDFRKKCFYFRSQQAMREKYGKCRIVVDRNRLFETAYDEIMKNNAEDLKKMVEITFTGEEGLDAGGLSREFYYLIAKEVFDPSWGLFRSSESYMLQINPASGIQDDHLKYFKCVGRIMGMSIFHRHYLDAHFVISFYKSLIGKPIDITDLEISDWDTYRVLQYLLTHEIYEGSGLEDFTFSFDTEEFGNVITHDLKPGGRDIAVTDENKAEYVQLLVDVKIKQVQEQFDALAEGFYELVPKNLIGIFNPQEVELLICGVDEIDVDDWMFYTDLKDYEDDDVTVQLFWKVVKSWNKEKQSNLLQFVTGTSRVPVNGFQDLRGSDGPRRFCLQKVGDPMQLPRAHTCFNRLDLPPYTSCEAMETKLTQALEMGGGFAFE